MVLMLMIAVMNDIADDDDSDDDESSNDGSDNGGSDDDDRDINGDAVAVINFVDDIIHFSIPQPIKVGPLLIKEWSKLLPLTTRWGIGKVVSELGLDSGFPRELQLSRSLTIQCISRLVMT